MHAEIFRIVAPVFLVVGIGYAIEASERGFHAQTLSRLAMWNGTPSLVFSRLSDTVLTPGVLAGYAGLPMSSSPSLARG